VRRGEEILVAAVRGDGGARIGWRPPGGDIESEAVWVALSRFRNGTEQLLPVGLIDSL
jgi:hypothetical protein